MFINHKQYIYIIITNISHNQKEVERQEYFYSIKNTLFIWSVKCH